MEDKILIKAVRKQVVLYDVSNLDYRHAEKTEKAWLSVSETVAQLRNKYSLSQIFLLTECVFRVNNMLERPHHHCCR